MTVIEVDGQNTELELVDSIQIFAGRLSQSFVSLAYKRQAKKVNAIPLS